MILRSPYLAREIFSLREMALPWKEYKKFTIFQSQTQNTFNLPVAVLFWINFMINKCTLFNYLQGGIHRNISVSIDLALIPGKLDQNFQFA